jgi:hypothetical protein
MQANGNGDHKIVRKRVSSLKPSPENELLYGKVEDDPAIHALCVKVDKNGCDPLVVTADNWLVSGHRRRFALLLNGQEFVRCLVLPVRRDQLTQDEFIKLLSDYNEQRQKTIAQQVREELVDIDEGDAYRRLCEHRDRSVNAAEHNGVIALEIEGSKKRHGISDQKAEHVKYIKKVVFEDRRDYWPLSVRGVHYALLNY